MLASQALARRSTLGAGAILHLWLMMILTPYGRPGGRGTPTPHLVGDPEALIERIQWAREYYACDSFMFEASHGVAPCEHVVNSLERFTKRVMPTSENHPSSRQTLREGRKSHEGSI